MSSRAQKSAENNRLAIQLLCKELGIINTVHFLKQFVLVLGDYVQEREDLFANKTLDQIVDEIERVVSRTAPSSVRRAPSKRLGLATDSCAIAVVCWHCARCAASAVLLALCGFVVAWRQG